MAKDSTSLLDMSAMMAQSVEQARGAMENYLKFFQQSMSASPWAQTDIAKKLTSYAEQNVASAIGHAQNLTKAKDAQELVRIQTEFFQTQLKALTDQAKDLGETTAKTTMDAFKGPIGPSK